MGPRCREAAGDRRAGWRARTGAASGLYDRWRAMAASPVSGGGGAGAVHSCNTSGFAFDSGLEIRTRSVEQTLLPLVSQVLRPRVPVCAARDGGCRFSLARHGGAGGGAVPHSVSAATARRDWRGGPGRGGHSWARGEAPEPSRCVVRPRWPDSPGAAASAQGGPAAGRWDPCGVPWLLEPRRLQLRSPPPPLSASQARPGRWTQAGALQFASHSGMFSKAFVPFPGPCVGSPNSHPLWPPVLSLPAICLPTSVYLDSAD